MSDLTNEKRFPVFHVPHDGDLFPTDLLASVCIPPKEFLSYHNAMRDTYVSALVPERYRNDAHLLRFPISRLLCDVERFIGPEEIMERYGMGYCYERAYDGTRIKAISQHLLERTKSYYDRHHEKLNRLCLQYDRVLLIDLHSYAVETIPNEFLQSGQESPDVCLGADGTHTPPWLIRFAEECCHQAGFTTAVNYPYSGCLVPNSVLSGHCRCDCVSVMLEIHKRAYLDENGRLNGAAARRLQDVIGRITEKACAFCPEEKNRRLRDLIDGEHCIYLYLASEAAKEDFQRCADSEQLRFDNGASAANRQVDSIMRLQDDGTVCYVGFAGTMHFHHASDPAMRRIDYEKYMLGRNDYIIKE